MLPHLRITILSLLGCGILTQCSPSGDVAALYRPSTSVTPSQSLAIANAYLMHPWTPSSANIQHGQDSAGILVNTPDITNRTYRKGWWQPGKQNISVPYKWGGFDTPAQFTRKVAKGSPAGDLYTAAKRKGLNHEISQEATGVDCSGFVSRCWRLPIPYSTRALPSICDKLPTLRHLQPGDILNKSNEHVALFSRYTPSGQIEVYEAVAEDLSRVVKRTFSPSYFVSRGYTPMRYQNMGVFPQTPEPKVVAQAPKPKPVYKKEPLPEPKPKVAKQPVLTKPSPPVARVKPTPPAVPKPPEPRREPKPKVIKPYLPMHHVPGG